MWFMMIVSIIFTAVALSQMVDPYTPAALLRAFWTVGLAALAIGLLGLFRLEPRFSASSAPANENYSWRVLVRFILDNRQALTFFVYLVILLAALLGQDILLEPFGGEAFGLTVQQTTRITSIWGGTFLVALLVAGALESRISKRTVAQVGGWGALAGFALIASSGVLLDTGVFYGGIMLLGIGSGLSTVSNLSLMMDMTTADKVGLFIGAWGMANAISRMLGSLLGGMLRDLVARLTQSPVTAYVVVFAILAGLMLASLLMLRRIDVRAFRAGAVADPSILERAAIASDAG
jgi:BCD family chlorophyll transporter-like MFS transporter